jgi:hypothetical protein
LELACREDIAGRVGRPALDIEAQWLLATQLQVHLNLARHKAMAVAANIQDVIRSTAEYTTT